MLPRFCSRLKEAAPSTCSTVRPCWQWHRIHLRSGSYSPYSHTAIRFKRLVYRRLKQTNDSCSFSVQCISSVQDSIYALGKAHIRSAPVSQKYPHCRLWNGSDVPLIDDGPLSSFQGRSSNASSFHASLFQAIDGAMSSALYPQVVSQAPQHFRSSEKQATREGCFSRQSVCSVLSLHSGMSRAVQPQEFAKVDVDHWQVWLVPHHKSTQPTEP